MKYGCIGEHLAHSFSAVVHAALADYSYEIREIPRGGLDSFMREGDFLGINVTIPYKEAVMPYLDCVENMAQRIGAVNTVVKRDGRLCGYNTDFYGMSALIEHSKIAVRDTCVAILGTGGTSKTAQAVCAALGARRILTVSRVCRDGVISYDELADMRGEIDVIINTTPVGMHPDQYKSIVDVKSFPRLSGVIDAIYNPLCTVLVSEAQRCNIPAEGGLYMLVAQAVRASEIFLGREYPLGTVDKIYKKILRSKENIVLIGMPASGKSTVGRLLAERLGRELIDTDELIVKRAGMEIPEIFKARGEEYFRELETSAVREASTSVGAIIATGGGAILREENLAALRQNGRLYFLDRPLSALTPTSSRPLASDFEAIKARYSERYDTYRTAADEIIDASRSAEAVAKAIGDHYE